MLNALSPDEQKRADRFHFPKHRKRFIIARAALREILGTYLDLPPKQLRFQYNRFGKPALINELDEDIIRFNLSHSDELAVYALSSGREVGIDVERVRDDFPSTGVAAAALSYQEIAALRRLPTHLQTEAFFKYWVCKEAYLKANGIGLSNQLSQFSVSLLADEQGELSEILENSGQASNWSIALFIPAPEYVGAVAREGKDWHLRCQHWAISDPRRVNVVDALDPTIRKK